MAEKKQTKAVKEEKNEREYVIPLRKEWMKVPRYKKANKAVKAIKEFLVRHMKVRDRDLRKVKVDGYLNEAVWSRGIKKPPARIKVKVVKEGENVIAQLVDFPDKLKFKKARLEKRDQKALEAVEAKKTMMEKAKETMTGGGAGSGPGAASQSVAEKPTEEQTEEKKEEEKEKKASVVEAGKEIEKSAAKQAKHQSKGNVKQPKHQARKALAK